MERREFLKLYSGAAALTAAGCTAPGAWGGGKAGGRKLRVVMWGICHEHAAGKFASLKKLQDDFKLVGLIDDRASSTARVTLDFTRYDGVPRMTEQQLFADKSIDAVFVEVTNDDLVDVGMKCALHGLPMHFDKPCGQTYAPFAAMVEECRRRNLPLQVGYMFRVNPAIRFIRKAVKDGWLGDIV